VDCPLFTYDDQIFVLARQVYTQATYVSYPMEGGTRIEHLYKFDTELMEWTNIETTSTSDIPIVFESFISQVYDGHLYVFGLMPAGWTWKNDFWKLNLTDFVWTHLDVPTLKSLGANFQNLGKRSDQSCLIGNTWYIFEYNGVNDQVLVSYDFDNDSWSHCNVGGNTATCPENTLFAYCDNIWLLSEICQWNISNTSRLPLRYRKTYRWDLELFQYDRQTCQFEQFPLHGWLKSRECFALQGVGKELILIGGYEYDDITWKRVNFDLITIINMESRNVYDYTLDRFYPSHINTCNIGNRIYCFSGAPESTRNLDILTIYHFDSFLMNLKRSIALMDVTFHF
jgi:hypothetical protein